MTGCEAGEVVLVPFPFADLQTTKQRPALVLRAIASPALPEIVLIAMITSRTDAAEIEGDCPIRGWEAAGLLKPSKVRLAKLVTIEHGLLRRRLGELAATDRRAVARTLRSLLGAWLG
jgi:mRNA interferase MazF